MSFQATRVNFLIRRILHRSGEAEGLNEIARFAAIDGDVPRRQAFRFRLGSPRLVETSRKKLFQFGDARSPKMNESARLAGRDAANRCDRTLCGKTKFTLARYRTRRDYARKFHTAEIKIFSVSLFFRVSVSVANSVSVFVVRRQTSSNFFDTKMWRWLKHKVSIRNIAMKEKYIYHTTEYASLLWKII